MKWGGFSFGRSQPAVFARRRDSQFEPPEAWTCRATPLECAPAAHAQAAGGGAGFCVSYGVGLLLLPDPPAFPAPPVQRLRYRPALLRRPEERRDHPQDRAEELPARQPDPARSDQAA